MLSRFTGKRIYGTRIFESSQKPGEYVRLSSVDMGRKKFKNPDGILFSMIQGNREYDSEATRTQ